MHKSLLILFFLACIAFVLFTRTVFRSSFLYSWDGAQFALSFEKFDVSLGQPHAPGYLLYSWTGRTLNRFVGDANLALISMNITATAAAAFLIFLLAMELSRKDRTGSGFSSSAISTILYITNPIVWFYGCVAEIYAVEGFFVLLIAYLLTLSERRPRAFFLASLVLAIAGGFRPTTEAFLFPLYLLFCRGKSGRIILSSILILIAINVAWLGTLIAMSGGSARYFGLLFNQFASTAAADNALKRALKVLMRTFETASLPLLAASLLRIRRIRFSKIEARFLWWSLFPILFFLFVEFPKDGYLMLVVPFLIVLSVMGCARAYSKRTVYGIAAAAIVMNCWIFVVPPVFTDQEMQASLLKWCVNRTFAPNRLLIKTHDGLLREFFKSVDSLSDGEKVFITEVDSVPDWRLLMYYRPNDKDILTFSDPELIPRVAFAHEFSLIHQPFVVEPSDSLMVFLPVHDGGMSLAFFDLYGKRYYYARRRELPSNFQTMSLNFVRN